jgi:hypothetical protein
MNRASADPVGDRRMSGRRHPVPMLYEERSLESRSGTSMSEIDRDLIPSREGARLLKRALGSAVPEFIARFGAADAIKRAEAELRRARRARSRKLYAFWSAVLAQIDPGRNEISIRGVYRYQLRVELSRPA